MIPRVDAMVVFVEDLDKCTAFYRDMLGFQVQEKDDVSISFLLGNQYFLLLAYSGAADLLQTDVEAVRSDKKQRGLLAAGVENVDALYETLVSKGVTFLRPPTDQPWGLRTAHFIDPEGNLWEINQPVRKGQ